MMAVLCSNCAGKLIFNQASTFCVYCGNPAIVFSRVSKEYRPDGIIPFKITKQEALAKIRKRFEKNPIVPKEFDEATNEKYFLFADYGVDPYAEKKHNVPVVLLKNAERDKHIFGNRGQE